MGDTSLITDLISEHAHKLCRIAIDIQIKVKKVYPVFISMRSLCRQLVHVVTLQRKTTEIHSTHYSQLFLAEKGNIYI